MKLHRITLTNFKGVASSSVSFADDGVTIVEGDNEAGKSTLLEAFDILLNAKSTSRKSDVLAAKPIGQDVGPEAEAELTIGGQRLTIRKRWLTSPESVLTLHGSPDITVTGGDAHDRLRSIIETHLDTDLLSALRVLQGAELAQAGLANRTLSSALDIAGGVDASGQFEDGLWTRIVTERDRYWTSTGRAKADRTTLETTITTVTAERDDVAGRLRELEEDVTRAERLAEQASQRRVRIDELTPDFEELKQAMEKVRDLTEQLDSADGERQRVDGRAQLALAAATARRGLVEEVSAREDAVAELKGDAQVDLDRETHERAVIEARAALDASESELERFRDAERSAVNDERLRRDLFDLELLEERLKSYREAQDSLTEAERTIRSTGIDADLLARIEAAHTDYLTASGTAAGQAVAVVVEALVPIDLSGDNTDLRVDRGTTEHLELTTRAQIKVPEGGTITITPGRNVEEVHARQLTTESELRRLLDEAGVEGVVEARQVFQSLTDARAEAERQTAAIRDALRDLTPESMVDLVNELRATTTSRLAERPTTSPLPTEVRAAEDIAAGAKDKVTEAERRRALAQDAFDAATKAESDARISIGQHQALLEQARKEREQAHQRLAAARTEKTDEEISKEVLEAQEALRQAIESVERIERELKDLDAESIRSRYENAEQSIDRAERERSGFENELRELNIELKVRGEQGLASQLDDLDRRLGVLTDERQRIDARADAAELLHQTFAKHRDAAKERYRAPLKQEIDRLGRIVFGEDLTVSLTDDLTISERTLDGRTMPFDQLSIGAQEQLGVLARLACASLVGGENGAPVILDDALGWSDPGRLVRMGAALNVAGKSSQVIVLTCFPERYAAVGDAKVVRIGS